MSKIIFMTNVIRRFGIMQQMLDKLQNNGEMQGDSRCWTNCRITGKCRGIFPAGG